MFPIPWNFPLRKKNGNLVNIGDAIDAGTEIPEHDEADAGKVLSVDENGDLEWSDEVNSEIQTLTNKLADEVSARAELGAHNLVDINGFTLIKSSARTKYIYPSDIIHGAIPSEQVVISFKVTNSNLSKSDNYFKAYGSGGEIGAVSFKANGRYSFVFDGASFNNFYIFISSNAESDETCTISEIMITLATDAYSEYTPYAKTNQELTAENQTLTNEASAIVNKLGAKNVMPVTMETIKRCNTGGTWNDNVYTFRGITYTIYTDAFGNVTKINANGTSDEASAHLFFADGYKKPSQLGLELDVEYALNGCPDGGDTYGYSVCYDSGGAWLYPSDFGEATTFTFTSDSNTYRPMIKVRNSGTVIDNKDFYPMLRDASIVNSDYAPYAMTNRELTDKVVKSSKIDLPSTSIAVGSTETITIPASSLPSDFHNALAIIPISVGPEGWSTTLPGVFTNVNLTNLTVSVRAYTAQNFAPTVILLYV